MLTIIGSRSGRPDYSQVIEKNVLPVPPKSVIGTTILLYWNGYVDVPPRMSYTFMPLDPQGNPFPGKGMTMKVKKLVASTDGDILFAVSTAEAKPDGSAFYFASEAGYQKIEITPELYPITYPNVFKFSIANYDSQTRRILVYWSGSEEYL